MRAASRIYLVMFLTLAALCWNRGSTAAESTIGLSQSTNAFACDLYKQLIKDDNGNVFISPYSISSVLAMVYAGAGGNTRAQMAAVLHYDVVPNIHEAFHDFNGRLISETDDRSYDLVTANALWGQEGYPFLSDFQELNRKYYGAGLYAVDFIGEDVREETRGTINAWVEKHTRGKIQDLIRPGQLSEATRLVLTNAIYFKGKWAREFKEEKTETQAFTVGTGGTANVPTMTRNGSYRYAEDRDVQCLILPYDGMSLNMMIVLPKEIDGLSSVEARLSADRLSEWADQAEPEPVTVFLPRFSAEKRYDLPGSLRALGMKDAFRWPGADFSGIDSTKKFFISNVIHQTFIDVDEAGTEAAAATAVVAVAGGKSLPQSAFKIFRADHPFIFMIRDAESGCVLFLGRVVDPTEK